MDLRLNDEKEYCMIASDIASTTSIASDIATASAFVIASAIIIIILFNPRHSASGRASNSEAGLHLYIGLGTYK